MHIKVTGKHIDVGDALRTHVEDRLAMAVAKYFDRAVSANVVFSRDTRNFFKCDASVDLSTGLHAQSQALADDIYAAFDQATDRIEKQIRRYKRRLKDHHQRRRDDPLELMSAQSYVLASAEEDADSEADSTDQPVIIAETKTSIHALSVGDAVMRMELGNVAFLVFKNESNGRLNVVYQRDDGNIGWIDPEYATQTA